MSAWDEAVELPAELVHVPPDHDRTPWTVTAGNGDVYYHVPADGYLMLIAYLAGAANLAWTSGRPRGTVKVVVERRGEAPVEYCEPHTDEDLETIEENISDYLMDAEVPPPPRDREWYLRYPRSVDPHQTGRRIAEHIRTMPRELTHPRDTRRYLEQIIRRLWAGD